MRGTVLAWGLSSLLLAAPAWAQRNPVEEVTIGTSNQERPSEGPIASTSFLGHAGALALPFAEACPFTGAQCEPGEVAIAAGMHVMGRYGDFGVGAGFTWAMGLKTSEAAGAAVLKREHSRSYLVLDGRFRYYLPPWRDITWWVGAAIGAVVINDTWTTLADREPYADIDLVGPTALSLSSEGFAASLELGGHWKFHDIWFVGTSIRYGNWLLPGERKQTPLGDLASLAGRLDVVEAGALLGFELVL